MLFPKYEKLILIEDLNLATLNYNLDEVMQAYDLTNLTRKPNALILIIYMYWPCTHNSKEMLKLSNTFPIGLSDDSKLVLATLKSGRLKGTSKVRLFGHTEYITLKNLTPC